MLHTSINPLTAREAFESALRIARPASRCLLLEDGVHGRATRTSMEALVAKAIASHPVYALEPDIRARGIAGIVDGVKRSGTGSSWSSWRSTTS